jgi:6-pyruvoyltetrahydropterin/6-carboxytetrahydropterin synthase
MFISTKTYTHAQGLSCAFRQWRADSHCRHIHGYALQIRIEFECEDKVLNQNNWVIDFGSLKALKMRLENLFDHKLLVAADDPELDLLKEMASKDLCSIQIVQATGCESFAYLVASIAHQHLVTSREKHRVRVRAVEVSEHGGNSARYEPDHVL